MMASKSTSVFNESNEGKEGAKIEWARWSWNPVTGCNHGCTYCYARDIAARFYPQGFKPTFHANRLNAPVNSKPPKKINSLSDKNVFVCSMGDLFGKWVPKKWIDRVLGICAKSPQWNYLLLTKNPERYLEFVFPENVWVGATIDVKDRLDSTRQIFMKIKAPVKFVSFEPLEEDMGVPNLSMFDWVIIGGRSRSTKMPAGQPEWIWVENLLIAARKSNCKVYFKPNLLSRPKEYPKEDI